MIYAINYDLNKPGQDYTGLYEAIRNCGEWWHFLDSHWLVDTTLSANEIWSNLSSKIDKNDCVLVVGVARDFSGWLPQNAWDWINARTDKMAA
tara:strand:+ start:2124 stop:2402 length:279 start_codon:yes stop_codon:yes gene_type:complete